MFKRRIRVLIVAVFTLVVAYNFYGPQPAQALDKDLMFYSGLADKYELVSNEATVGVNSDDPIAGGPCCNCACAGDGSCTKEFTGRDCYVNGGCGTDSCGATATAE